MTDDALIGSTGFVGSVLSRQISFQSFYNSKNIHSIRGRSFSRIVCAAAPATMWAANRNPEADWANINLLIENLRAVETERFVLISTIAVLDDASAGYTEADARYEVNKAYGRHRRELEERLAENFANFHILRLPALFGPGLKKNFVFDLRNPIPSFIKPDKFSAIEGDFTPAETALLAKIYVFDDKLGMWSLDREQLRASPGRAGVEAAFERIGFLARNFTNSASRFQFYNMSRLAADIERVIESGLSVVNMCSEPLEAACVSRELTGKGFTNDVPPLVREDMRSIHAGVFGGNGPYLFDRASILADLKSFFAAEATAGTLAGTAA